MAKRLAQSDWTADDLRVKRESLGMNKAEMSRKLGVTYRQYMYYEKGLTKIRKGLEQFINDLRYLRAVNEEKSQGTLSDFEKDRINMLLSALENHPLDDLNERTKKILRQSSEELELLLSKLVN